MSEEKKENLIEVEGKVVMFKYGCPVLDIHYSEQGAPQHYLNFKKHEVQELATIHEGDWVKVRAEKADDRKTIYVTEVLEHKKVEKATEKKPITEPEGAVKKTEKPKETEVVFEEKMEAALAKKSAEIAPFIHMLVPVDKIVDTFEKIKQIKARVLEEKDFLYVDKDGKFHKEKPSTGAVEEYIKKTGWQKFGLAFSLDFEPLSKMKHVGRDKHGEYYVWTYRYKISHPSGKFVITEGSCSSRDSFFGKKYGEIVEPTESNIMHTAQTVCINRGVSILLGGGVSAEEMMKQRE